MATTTIVTRPNRVLDAVLAIVLVVAGVSAYFVAGAPKAPAATVRTTTVTRGAVLSSVQASGNVQTAAAFSVGFQTGGTVTGIDVKVGQSVVKGQTLANLDPTIAAANLASASAGVTAARARLAQVEQVQTPTQQAQAAAAAVSAQQQVVSAQSNLTAAQSTASLDATQLQQAITDAQTKLNSDQTAQASATQISQDQTALTQAQNAQASGLNKDQQSVTQAQNQLAAAQDSSNATNATNAASAQLQPADLTAAQASLTQAQAQYASALQTMGWTTLQAPTSGVVTAISGAVGQTVSGGGISASQGSTTAGSSSSSSGGTSSTSTSTSSGTSSAFLTVTDLGSLSVKAGFAEADAAKLKVGQPAVISFSALPNAQASGVVTEVDANSTLVSNVVTYYATVQITKVPTGVKPGMTASVTVTINRRDGVLTLPSAAVRGTGSTGTVTVENGKQQSTVTVGVGLRGDTLTEITSGLTAGQTVVLPSSTVSGVSSQVGSGNAGRFVPGGTGGLGGTGTGTGTGAARTGTGAATQPGG
jgi:HlyD family secretion protein